MSRLFRPSVERLEDRMAPATWGNPWPDAAHLTLSFAPDGTAFAGKPSEMFAQLNAAAPMRDWQLAILRAFQTWAVHANINLALVADGGQPFATPGPIQGDARFGDIRMAAVPMSADEAAAAAPFDPMAGNWSGDVRLDSRESFGLAGQGQYDLFSVMLHEAGHVFGLDHGPNQQSAMYAGYLGPRTGLSTEDITALQAIYGPRTPDQYEGPSGNEQRDNAMPLWLLPQAHGSLALNVTADRTTSQDCDYYRFTTPLQIGNLAVRVHTGGHSLLAPRVTVYDVAGNVVGQTTTTDPLAGGATVRVSGLGLLKTYFIRVDGGRDDVFGVGSYELRVQYTPLVNNLLGGLVGQVQDTVDAVTTVLLNNDLHTNDSFLTALNLQQLLSQPDRRFDYMFRGSISDSWDVDYYRLKAPAGEAGTSLVMTAMLWGLNSSLNGRVQVFDAQQNAVAAEVLVNEAGSYIIPVPNAVPNAIYYVKVLAAKPNGPQNVGNYFLGVDFGTQAVPQQDHVTMTLTDANRQAFYELKLDASQFYHFILSADREGGRAEAAVRMTIFDKDGRAVFTRVAAAGDPASGNVYLPRGKYTVRFAAGTPTGAALPTLAVKLRGSTLTSPIGPEPDDSTDAPAGSSPPPSEPPPPDSTRWTQNPPPGNVPPQDPYSDPYSNV